MITLVDILPEDFVNYSKSPSLYLAFPCCSFKCDLECGMEVCQNSRLAGAPKIEIDEELLAKAYKLNPITGSIVMAGLEPFDTADDMYKMIAALRNNGVGDPVVIYTGYTREELEHSGDIEVLRAYDNIIVKFGRFIPNRPHHIDNVLGVELASDNQYAEKIS